MTILLSSLQRGDLVVNENGKPYYIVEEVIDFRRDTILLTALWVANGQFEKQITEQTKTRILEGAIVIRGDTILR